MRTPCECGCGQIPLNAGSRFLRGHNGVHGSPPGQALGNRLLALLSTDATLSPDHPGAIVIPLTGAAAAGRVALVDEADYDLVAAHAWNINLGRHRRNSVPYAQTNIHRPGGKLTIGMHKLITGWPRTDHINHNGLDNRRANLRSASGTENLANQRPVRGGTSQFKGVRWHVPNRNWTAHIAVARRQRHIGSFSSEIEAALAYDAAAREAFGEFAYLNFPDDTSLLGAAS
jgi:AP2 domain